jgi:hypothetical protein
MVNREISWTLRLRETLYHLGKHLLIKFFGHEERFGKNGRIRKTLILVTLMENLIVIMYSIDC